MTAKVWSVGTGVDNEMPVSDVLVRAELIPRLLPAI